MLCGFAISWKQNQVDSRTLMTWPILPIYRNVPIRSALPNRSAPQVSLYIVTD